MYLWLVKAEGVLIYMKTLYHSLYSNKLKTNFVLGLSVIPLQNTPTVFLPLSPLGWRCIVRAGRQAGSCQTLENANLWNHRTDFLHLKFYGIVQTGNCATLGPKTCQISYHWVPNIFLIFTVRSSVELPKLVECIIMGLWPWPWISKVKC